MSLWMTYYNITFTEIQGLTIFLNKKNLINAEIHGISIISSILLKTKRVVRILFYKHVNTL